MKFKVRDSNTKEIVKNNLTFDEAHDFVVAEHEKAVLVIELDSTDSAPAGDEPHDNAIMAGIR